MIKVFYIEDNNGQYVSADGSKRWTRLTGQALYDFLQTERGKKTYFFVDTDDNGVAIGVEITDKELVVWKLWIIKYRNVFDYIWMVH